VQSSSQHHVSFKKSGKKIWGPALTKIGGQKNMPILAQF